MNATRVLLVEDEIAYARFLRATLAEADSSTYAVTCVDTLETAIAALSPGGFDIVLLDLGLPDADGIEAVTRVRAECPGTPIVVLSGLSDLDTALESMRLGAQEYFVKGQFENTLLPRTIRYAIERQRLQDGVAAARAEAERANAAKDEFLAMLGHELRNPLAPIANALALARRRSGVMTERELMIVERQVARVVRLVDDLLDVSRIARGKFELERTAVDIADVVADGVETAGPLLTERHHTLTVDAPRGRWFVDGDRPRLAQVAANLLTNAAKYTDPGGTIRVTTQADDDEVELRVRDNGVGMTPELRARAFEMFEQGPRAMDRSIGGLGLGLSIVRSIATLHGGRVAVASDGPGAGSEFIVILPRRAAAPELASAPTRPESADAPRRVLIVDDNEDAAEMMDIALHAMGHATRVANDAHEALALAAAFHPDVALLDIGLPRMDGYELARCLREQPRNRDLVLIAVTGYGQQSDRARAFAASFDHHLVKPVDLDQLEAILQSIERPAP